MTESQKAEISQREAAEGKRAATRMGEYRRGNYFLLLVGSISALVNGAIWPIFALFFADMIDVLSKFDALKAANGKNLGFTWEDTKSDAVMISIYFIIISIVSLITNFIQISSFHAVGQKITTKLRIDLFKRYLTMDQSFFDIKDNMTGNLASVLAKDCLAVNSLVSTTYGAILQGFGSMAGGLIIAFYSSWRLAFIATVISPLIALTGYVESKISVSSAHLEAERLETKTFQETCTNMKTVNALNAQSMLMRSFEKYTEKECSISGCKMQVQSLFFGLGQFGNFGVYACVFYFGAVFTYTYGLSFRDLFRALFSVFFAAYGAGMSQQFMPNLGEAQLAARRIFKYLDVQSVVESKNGKIKKMIQGKIEFRNVKFTYPERNTPCFTNLSFTILPKQKVAFAGTSGAGKSTIFSLLYRFYEPDSGSILVDDEEISHYDLNHLRQSLGMVSQTPKLFNSTIRYNIAYNRQMSDAEVTEAAQIANALNFIEKDQIEGQGEKIEKDDEDDGKGFDRKVGVKGDKLSGGQRQRVAIARIVARKPIVYLFDEATSALDTESEKIVQDALNVVSSLGTTLTIAHRISTIREADVIFVIDNGEVVESGTFEQLLDRDGVFSEINARHALK